MLNVHHNHPGVLKAINSLLGDYNIASQHLDTEDQIGYLIIDMDSDFSKEIVRQIKSADWSVKTRVLI